MPDTRAGDKNMPNVNKSATCLIQWDNRSKQYPWRVVTLAGECLAYFRDARDAIAFCN
jgi:hypothetical protein